MYGFSLRLKFVSGLTKLDLVPRVFFASVASLIAVWPGVVLAYNVNTTKEGQPLRWPTGEVGLELDMAGGPDSVSQVQAEAAAINAVSSWQRSLTGSRVTLAVANTAGRAASGDGVPSVRWAVDDEDPSVDEGRLAITEVSYRVADGEIQDADIVVNAVEFGWTVEEGSCAGAYDLEGALAHELGHLLGLGHSVDEDATMFSTGAPCETHKRDLTDDDQSGVHYLYVQLLAPEGNGPDVVDPVGCSAGGGAGGWSALLVVAALVGLARRRRIALVVVGAALAHSAPASAAELRRLELDELAGRSDAVVRGVVMATAPADEEELATVSVVLVSECLAGDCPAWVQVRSRGGERDGVGLFVDGEAELGAGREVVVYLRARPDKLSHRVVGGVQGALTVVRGESGLTAERDLSRHRVLVDGAWQSGGVERVDLAVLRRALAR
jgi:uncharacterized protein (TIGR03382 family)